MGILRKRDRFKTARNENIALPSHDPLGGDRYRLPATVKKGIAKQ